jgi:DNA helicase-2/ATP-dependent DNA helicase PcrA
MLPAYRDGFSVADPESELYQDVLTEIAANHGLSRSAKDAFSVLGRGTDGQPISQEIPEAAAVEFWNELAMRGAVDFASLVYHSYQLLVENQSIARGLAARYAWFLVDESQDTSGIQVRILEAIQEVALPDATKFFLVGDPMQSIFGFAGARPDMMDDFAALISANTDLELRENFRSSDPIIRLADRLSPRSESMKASGPSMDYNEEPRYVHGTSPYDVVSGHFLPWIEDLDIPYGQAAVLAPWWIPLYQIGRRLRQDGVRVSGPGARPYRRAHHLIAPIAEQVGAYLARPDPDRLRAVEHEVFRLIAQVTGRADFRVFTYDGRRAVMRLIRLARPDDIGETAADAWLDELAVGLSSTLSEADLLPRSSMNDLSDSAKGIQREIRANQVDQNTLKVSDLGVFGDPDRSLKLLTLHRAKGREFDAVAIIDVHKGKFPHYMFENDASARAEARRLFYVGITRAKRVLMVATDQSHWRNEPASFLYDLGFV